MKSLTVVVSLVLFFLFYGETVAVCQEDVAPQIINAEMSALGSDKAAEKISLQFDCEPAEVYVSIFDGHGKLIERASCPGTLEASSITIAPTGERSLEIVIFAFNLPKERTIRLGIVSPTGKVVEREVQIKRVIKKGDKSLICTIGETTSPAL